MFAKSRCNRWRKMCDFELKLMIVEYINAIEYEQIRSSSEINRRW